MVMQLLHVGCGPAALPNRFGSSRWEEIRFDINPDVSPDIVGSITDMHAVPDGTIDVIWSSHNLEHIYAHEIPQALGEFLRVLRPEGVAMLALPDLQQVARLIVDNKLEEVAYQSPAGPVCAIDIVYGHRGFVMRDGPFMQHKTGFTPDTLAKALLGAGFAQVQIKRGDTYNMSANAYKSWPCPLHDELKLE